MSVSTKHLRTAERVRQLIAALRPEDLEERIAPVKCSKHPDSPECGSTDYGAPLYEAPAYGVPDYGVPVDAGSSGAGGGT
jgi:hypothetical protein